MPALSTIGDSGGGGEAFRAKEGQQPGVLAEVVDTGQQEYMGKTRPTCKAVFVLPEDIVGDDAPEESRGEPKLVYWFVNNNRFTNSDDPDYRTAFEKGMATWAGKTIPKERQLGFLFGRELGQGEDEWDKSLDGDAMKAQIAKKCGIPVGSTALLHIVHVQKGDKTHSNPANAYPPSMQSWMEQNPDKAAKDYGVMAGSWKPGISTPDKNAKRYTFDEKRQLLCDGKPTGYVYKLDAEREAEKQARVSSKGGQSSSGSSQSAGVQQKFEPEPEDESIPF